MKFGVQHPSFSYDGKSSEIVDSLRRVVTQAERSGFDSFWVMDHFHQIEHVGEPHEPMLESWTTLSGLAGVTSKIRLGTLVTGNVYRHPSVVAKIGATLDVLSKGRLFMGIGAAWNEDESNAYGIPFPSTRERLERLDEAVQVIRKMWTEQPANFNGHFYQIHGAYCNPQPIQKPHPPILIGGSGERRTLRTVAKYGDACNLFGSPETVKKKLAVLRDHCTAVGREYNSILKTKLGTVLVDKDRQAVESKVAEAYKQFPEPMRREFVIYGTPEDVRQQIEEFRSVGIEYLIVNFEPRSQLEAMDLFADEVVSHYS